MKYVFLTNSMGGYSGGPVYVRNKLVFLKDKGWKVLVFDSTGWYNSEIKMEEFFEFENNRYQELFFNPFWLRKSRRDEVVSEIVQKIGRDDDIVIESNGIYLSIWGELISSLIGAKHIVYVISEKTTINAEPIFQFYKFKAERKELFSISENAYNILLSKFEKVSDANQHYWSAAIFVPIEDVKCIELEHVKKADYNIGHFGRRKGYFDEMFKGVAGFANKNKDKSVNFILLGDAEITEEQKKALPSNVSLYQLSSRQPLPKMFFDKTDVVIATAGCASIAAMNDAKVISMDVYNNQPLGILGYNTIDVNIRSKGNEYRKPLSETLDDVLVNKLYDKAALVKIQRGYKGYDYQLSFAVPSDYNYYDVKKIGGRMRNIQHGILRTLLFFNQISICSSIRYNYISRKNKR